MGENREKNKHETPNVIGNCKCCNKVIYDDNLYVEIQEELYLFSCYNRKVQMENEQIEE